MRSVTTQDETFIRSHGEKPKSAATAISAAPTGSFPSTTRQKGVPQEECGEEKWKRHHSSRDWVVIYFSGWFGKSSYFNNMVFLLTWYSKDGSTIVVQQNSKPNVPILTPSPLHNLPLPRTSLLHALPHPSLFHAPHLPSTLPILLSPLTTPSIMPSTPLFPDLAHEPSTSTSACGKNFPLVQREGVYWVETKYSTPW